MATYENDNIPASESTATLGGSSTAVTSTDKKAEAVDTEQKTSDTGSEKDVSTESKDSVSGTSADGGVDHSSDTPSGTDNSEDLSSAQTGTLALPEGSTVVEPFDSEEESSLIPWIALGGGGAVILAGIVILLLKKKT